MGWNFDKYVGRTVVIVYMDSRKAITQRTVQVRSAKGGVMRAFCLHRKAPRLFRLEHILAVMPRPVSGKDAG